ncbi:MAG: SDR family oxidoreductase [Deltaproteobacteria bacterium]|nr:SDR family oxidoreductase [Deltaproteobacteria bacterium]
MRTEGRGNRVLITGVTGFVGKVVLEEILRRSEEFDLDRVYVLIRPGKKGHSPQERFHQEVATSPCFSLLPAGWESRITVVAGELSETHCGLSVSDREELAGQLTHLINCAASVEFDLPLAVAAKANITSSLNVLELAKSCKTLQRFVNVSTAYVTPHRGDSVPVPEAPVPLPRSAREIYQTILSGRFDTKALLKETGHPNTYTYTKCLSEHLLLENRGKVSMTIVRPSIVSACWKYPFPGWIDSRAAFAGFVSLIGSGYLQAVVVREATLLDIVPCDVVADRILRCAFERVEADPETPQIRHAVAGPTRSCSVRENSDIIEAFFRRYPVDRYPNVKYRGPDNLEFRLRHWQWHQAPNKLRSAFCGLTGKTKQKKQVERLAGTLHYLNTGFPYFTHCTFDFQVSMPIDDPDFEKKAYIETVCKGVYRHLMKKSENEVTFAGRKHRGFQKDLAWTITRPKGNWAIRTSAYLARKVLRRCADQITFDRAAFEKARAAIPRDTLLIIVPTHRSYLDFILCSYLFFSHPELGIAIPHIAAAQEFGKIPLLGKLIKQTQAFYVQRGLGRENPELTRQIHDLVHRQESLEFFIEGTRSRSRQALKPRRGILKCLQGSGQKCTILPVSISYDRVPEASTFRRELSGAPKPKMRLGGLLAWLGRVTSGEIRLGRIHMACGQPLAMDPDADLMSLSREVMAELQGGLTASSYHLRAFLRQHPIPGLGLDWLKQAIEARGGRVIESPLKDEEKNDEILGPTFNYQWSHCFFAEALSAFPEHPAIQSHVRSNLYLPLSESKMPASREERLQFLLQALFEPVCRDYYGVADVLGQRKNPPRSAAEFLPHLHGAHLPNIEACLEDLVAREILTPGDKGEGYRWGPKAQELNRYREACRWPETASRLAAVG